ncbi:MAG: sulfotransferase domain-containing protein [Desulfobacterales bacterium]|nr:sulfotransferase domain-containing protein [Desulfobacterales bacterium]
MNNEIFQRILKQIKSAYSYWGFRFFIRPTDTFIVSYPKSGTTWLSFLVANILKDDLTVLNLKNSINYIPDINKVYLKRKGYLHGSLKTFNQMQSPRIFKVHSPYDPLLKKVIYVLRDPRDVMISYWHYQRMCNKNFFLDLKSFIELDDIWPCRWDSHVAGWLNAPNKTNILFVYYESLKQNPEYCLKKVLDFIGITYGNKQISTAIKSSSFKSMQTLEDRYGTSEKLQNRQERFVRKGLAGGWKQELDAESLLSLEAKFAKEMQRAGYRLST